MFPESLGYQNDTHQTNYQQQKHAKGGTCMMLHAFEAVGNDMFFYDNAKLWSVPGGRRSENNNSSTLH